MTLQLGEKATEVKTERERDRETETERERDRETESERGIGVCAERALARYLFTNKTPPHILALQPGSVVVLLVSYTCAI